MARQSRSTPAGRQQHRSAAYAAAQAHPTLRPLSLSGTGQVGVASTIGIVGATIGSTITVSAGTLPDGLVLSSANRRISGTPTVAGAQAITLTETLTDAVGSPKTTDVSAVVEAPPNLASGVDYRFVRTDENRIVPRSNASAQTVTIPPNSEVAFPIDTILTVEQSGAGALTVVAGDGVTLHFLDTLSLVSAGQYGVIQARKTDTDTWTVFGALAAA